MRRPRERAATVALAASLAVTLAAGLAGCSGDPPASSGPTPSPRASATPSAPGPSSATPQSGAGDGAAASSLRAAQRALRTAGTGSYVVSTDRAPEIWRAAPRVTGSFDLPAGDQSSQATSTRVGHDPETVSLRIRGSGAWFQVLGVGSVLEPDCWASLAGVLGKASIPTYVPAVAVVTQAEAAVAAPVPGAAREVRTSAPLGVVLAAAGYQQDANSLTAPDAGRPVPVTVLLGAQGRAPRGWQVAGDDLAVILAEVSTASGQGADLGELPALVQGSTSTGRFRGLGDPVRITPPPSSRVLDLSDPKAACRG